MNTDDSIVLLAAAPATAYREYLYRPHSRLARWIDARFDVVAGPGQRIDQAPQLGDVLLEVTLGRVKPGRCLLLKAHDPELEVLPRRLCAGQLLLRPRKRAEMSEPLPVEPTVEAEGSNSAADVAAGAPVAAAAAPPPTRIDGMDLNAPHVFPLIADLKADGITVRPIAQLGGDTGFGEIFLDDVFVPDADVIGAVNDGWRAAMSTSSNERGMSLRSPARFLASAERLAEVWKANGDSSFGDQVADAWIKAQAYRLHTFGTVTRLAGGGELGAESSVTKVFWSDLDVAIHQTALEIRGADGELANAWTDGLLFALGGPIYAGTNEIQRNIIAERLLGLPREKSK